MRNSYDCLENDGIGKDTIGIESADFDRQTAINPCYKKEAREDIIINKSSRKEE
jgi:hypothetical protein